MKNKVILDEMQQKTLLEIEHKTLHIALTGLLIVILMQQIFWKDGQNTLGEAAVLARLLASPALRFHVYRPPL